MIPIVFSLSKLPRIYRWSIFDFMSGKHLLDPGTFLRAKPVPVHPIAFAALIALTMIRVSFRVDNRRDFQSAFWRVESGKSIRAWLGGRDVIRTLALAAAA